MENIIRQIESPHFDEKKYAGQIKRIAAIAEEAEEKVNFASAHDPEVLKAIDIVEQFLRKTHRLCYGGQAINAHLPAKYKFYDPNVNIPDYDFFTPDRTNDIKQLVEYLRKAGFSEISDREGMHEGTTKIYVNYIPVADITEIDPKLYELLAERQFIDDHISYLDSNTLRMLMYLELSRPKGEVTRWEKVYERLLLLNNFDRVKKCPTWEKKIPKGLLTAHDVDSIMDYIVEEQRVFAGADLTGFYKSSLRSKKAKSNPSGKAKWLMKTNSPILFYSPDLETDTKHMAYELQHSSSHKTTITKVAAIGGDLIPPMAIFMRDKTPFLIIMSQTACHSYYSIPIGKNKILRAASLDTLIVLFFGISLLKYKYLSLMGLECLAKELVEISYRARLKPDQFPFPFVSLDCAGHQKRLPSLIREKVLRIRATRKKMKKLLLGENVEDKNFMNAYETIKKGRSLRSLNKSVKRVNNLERRKESTKEEVGSRQGSRKQEVGK